MNPLSSKPTYLNYRPNAGAVPATSASVPNLNDSSLIVYIASTATPTLTSHLNTILSQQRIRETILLGPREDVLKTLRTEVYTIAGKQRQDVIATIKVVANGAIEDGIKSVVKKGLVGVLVCEASSPDAEIDILEMGTGDLESIWRTTVLPLHTLLRHTLPLLSTTATPSFFYLDAPAAISPTFTSISKDALLSTASTSAYARNVTIGSAAEHLPQLSDAQSMRSLSVDTNGAAKGNGGGNWETYGQAESPTQPESPTKLWASWAAQNDFEF